MFISLWFVGKAVVIFLAMFAYSVWVMENQYKRNCELSRELEEAEDSIDRHIENHRKLRNNNYKLQMRISDLERK